MHGKKLMKSKHVIDSYYHSPGASRENKHNAAFECFVILLKYF